MAFNWNHGIGNWLPDTEGYNGVQYQNIYNYSSNVGINNPLPKSALDISGILSVSSNVETQAGVVAKSITLNDAYFDDTNFTFSSNTAVWGSNSVGSALEKAIWSSNLNPTVLWSSNAASFGSNLAPKLTSTSNAAYFGSNLSPKLTATSNVAYLAASTADWTSNNALLKSGGTVTGNLRVDATGTLSTGSGAYFQNAYVGQRPNNVNLFQVGHSNLLSDVGAYALAQDSTGSTFINAGSNQSITLRNNNVAGMILDASRNVGIGTETPSQRLHVTPGFAFSQDSNSGLFHIAEDTVGLTTGSVERLRVDGSGRVGVGLSNPAYTLDVAGTVNATDYRGMTQKVWNATKLGAINVSGTNKYYKIASVRESNWGGSSAAMTIKGFLGGWSAIQKAQVDLTYATRGALRVFGTVCGFVDAAKTLVDIVSYVEADGTYSVYIHVKVSITNWELVVGGDGAASGVTLFEPTSTITSTPTGTVSNSSFISEAGMYMNDALLTVTGKVYATSQVLANTSDTPSVPGFAFAQDSNTGLFHIDENVCGITTGSVERLRVDGTGNVGIGTAPTHKLDVNGTTRFRGDTYVDNATEQLVLMSEASYAIIGGASNGIQNAASIGINGRTNTGGGTLSLTATDNAYIGFSTINVAGTGTEWMRMTGNGKLGIGTTTPAYELDIPTGTARIDKLITNSDVTSGAWTLGPCLQLNQGYMDLLTGTTATYSLNLESGNPGAYGGSMFHSGFLNGTDSSGTSLVWSTARLLIRGCRTGTNTTASTCTMQIRVYNTVTGWVTVKKPDGTTDCQFDVTDAGSSHGYTTNVSPAFKLTTAQLVDPVLGIRITTPAAVTYRLGPVYLSLST
jgi:hypothetical protein